MKSEKYQLIERMFARLCLQAGTIPEAQAHRRERFIQSLLPYPDDLVCAAYHRVLHYAHADYLPSECDFILFITPEYNRRRMENYQEVA